MNDDEARISWSGPHPYCKPHASHFCPCLKPELYDPNDEQDRKYLAGWVAIAPIIPFDYAREAAEPTYRWAHRLTAMQSQMATEEGERRERQGGYEDTVYDPGEESLPQRIRAAKGELAMSLLLGLPWTALGAGNTKNPDVGDYYEVRSVELARKGLIVRPNDAPHFDAPFILTLVIEDDVTAMGWKWGREAANDRLYPPPPSSKSTKKWWLVKPHKLEPMASLPPHPTQGDT